MSVTELLGGAIGCALLGLGGAALVAWSLRRRPTDRVLLLFGLWCGLYGARLIIEQSGILATIGGSPRGWTYVRAFTTYAINVPTTLFFESLIGPGWKQSVRRAWQFQAAFAIVAIGVDLMTGRPNAAMGFNSVVVLIGVTLGLVNVWLFRHRLSDTFKTSAVVVSSTVLLLLVINANLGPLLLGGVINLEPLGVFAFVMSLGYGVVSSVFRQEAELAAVQRELETARQIQTTLLPRDLPEVPGLDLAARYLPMTAVAGDLYDFVRLGSSQVGILVADVAGHGVPAALVASMVKLAFSTQVEQAHDPALVLGAVNNILCRHVEGTYVTAIYAVIDTERRTIAVATAGHPPLLIGRADRTVEESGERGLMLGVLPGARYENGRLDLRDGDCIFLYTDGIPETQSPKGDFLDLDRVRGWLASTDGPHNRHDAARFAESALHQLRQWRGGTTFEDDVTLVVARFTEKRAVSPDSGLHAFAVTDHPTGG